MNENRLYITLSGWFPIPMTTFYEIKGMIATYTEFDSHHIDNITYNILKYYIDKRNDCSNKLSKNEYEKLVKLLISSGDIYKYLAGKCKQPISKFLSKYIVDKIEVHYQIYLHLR